jgi:hypothetical protein
MAERASARLVVPVAAFVAGGIVSLLLGVYGKQHQPTFKAITTFGFGSMIEMKVYLALAVGVLAIGQVVGALWLYGKLGITAPSWLGPAHRLSGTLAILVSLPVAYHCLWALGFQSGGQTSTRVVVHSIVGCAVYGALVVKVVAVHAKSAPGWMLPVAGGLLFALIVAVVWTSAIWYVGANGWPSGGGY